METEKRLIDANGYKYKLIRELNKTGKYTAYECGLDDAISYLNEQPTIDAVEVVHGRWIYDGLGDGERICSVCRRYALYTHRDRYEQYLTNYCPNCGAIMDGAEDGK